MLTGLALAWVALLWAAPGWRAASADDVLRRTAGGLVYVAGAGLCHQRPERSFTRATIPLPVCGRCTGLYLGGALSLLAAVVLRPRDTGGPGRWRRALLIGALPTMATLVLEWSGSAAISNAVRAVAAVPLGALGGWMLGAALGVPRPDTGATIGWGKLRD